ncbi:MAG: TonB family protein [Myxococcota bacterium]|nr:TonB family protein [Myxococcota bacterium]
MRIDSIIVLAFLICSGTVKSAHAQGSEQAPSNAVETKKNQLTKVPAVIRQVAADYPKALFENGVTGTVLLRITIDDDGTPSVVEVAESSTHPEFDVAAQAAVRQFRFSPAEIDGQPAAVQIMYRYRFTIEKAKVAGQDETDIAGRESGGAKQQNRPVGVLRGIVLEKGTQTPLAGFLVTLVGLDLEAVTDGRGAFVFSEVPAGPVSVSVDGESHYEIQDEEQVNAGEEATVKYYVERRAGNDTSITVVGRRVRKDVARRVLSVEEIRKIPGTSGDALKVVQNLPGVARMPFGVGGGVVIRGSNPGDSATVVEGHFVPLVFHFGGLRAVLPNELIKSISFYPGNFSAEFGRFAGGVVDVRLRRPRSDRLYGRIEADVFDAGVFFEGPLHDGATFAIGGRRSYIDALLPAVVGDGSATLSIAPRYYDFQAVYDYKVGRHRLRVIGLGSNDVFEAVLENPVDDEPTVRGGLRNETEFYRAYLEWAWAIRDDVTHSLSVAAGFNSLFLELGPDLYADNQATVVTVRDELTVKLNDKFKLKLGLDTEVIPARLRISLPLPPKEGDARSQSLSSRETVAIDKDALLFNPALWTQWELRLFDKRLLMMPGLRVEYDYRIRAVGIDPRLSTRFTIIKDSTALKAGAGLYTQRPSPDESDDEFGDPSIGFERAVHVSAGVEHKLTSALEVDVIGFYKYLYDLVVPTTNESGEASLSGVPSRTLSNDGIGRVYGLEVLLRHPPKSRFFGWISYTLMRAERRDPLTGDYRLFDFDQTHILAVVAQYKLTNTWEIGGRFRYVTGRPYTPVTGSVYNVDANTFEGVPGEINSRRSPHFHSLDIRIDRNWIFETWILTAYLELRNAYNRENVEVVDYNFDFSDARNVMGLPIIPSLGIRGEF